MTTGSSPVELLLKLEQQVETKFSGQKENYDKRARGHTFTVADRVCESFEKGETWLPGYIVQTLGPVLFQVQLTDR